jgi:hypothetical protein
VGRQYPEKLKTFAKAPRKEIGATDMLLVFDSYRAEGIPNDWSNMNPEKVESPGRLGIVYILKT